jgi:hypothetical protein
MMAAFYAWIAALIERWFWGEEERQLMRAYHLYHALRNHLIEVGHWKIWHPDVDLLFFYEAKDLLIDLGIQFEGIVPEKDKALPGTESSLTAIEVWWKENRPTS